MTEIEESALANPVEQRLNDELLEDESAGYIQICRLLNLCILLIPEIRTFQ